MSDRRLLAISDIHGQKRKLLSLLEKAAFDSSKDKLIICGDMIDRGPQNLATIELCRELQEKGAVLLKGNHEAFLEKAILELLKTDVWRRPSSEMEFWIRENGGNMTFDEIEILPKERLRELLQFIQNLPLYHRENELLFVHAGVDRRQPIEKNSENDLLWANEDFYYNPAYSGQMVVFGHVPTWYLRPYNRKDRGRSARIWYDAVNKDKIGIDCGSVFGGRLAALELPSRREFYA